MPVYKVRAGDCLTKIAADHGFGDYKAIYDHPENAMFKAKRPNPHIIHPGDEVFIPPIREKTATFSTGMVHRIVVKRPPAEIRLHVKDADGEPFTSRSYILRAAGDNTERRGTTDDTGLVRQPVPADCTEASLEFPEDGVVFQLRLGNMDPLGEKSGLRGRLENLGYSTAGGDDGAESDEALRYSLARFQTENDLEATGNIDVTTADKLRELHDHGEES